MQQERLPSLWRSLPLHKVARLYGGGTPSRNEAQYFEGNIPWLTGYDLPEDQVSDVTQGREYITQSAIENSATVLVPSQTVLLTTRVTVGKVAVTRIPLCYSQDLTGIVVNDTSILDPSFLAYTLLTFRELLGSLNRGTTITGVTRDDVARLQIPLPPLPEQQMLVTILRKADELRQLRLYANRRSQDLLPSLFQEMFGKAFRSNGYQQNKLGQVADVVSGVAKGRKFGSQNPVIVPYLRVANVQDGFLDLEEIKTIEALPIEVELYRLQKGDVLLTEGGDFDKLGRGAIWNADIDNCIHQNHIFRVRLDQSVILPEVFAQFLRTPHTKAYFLRAAKKTTNLASINMTQLRSLLIPLIPMEKQKEYIRRSRMIVESSTHQSTSEINVNTLFKSLVAHAFTGKLTAAWREAHYGELVRAAAERDHLLGIAQVIHLSAVDIGVSVEIGSPTLTTIQEANIETEIRYKRQALFDSLSPVQMRILTMIRTAKDYVTPQNLNLDENGRRTMHLFASSGLIQQVSVPTNPSGTIVYTDVYRALKEEEDVLSSDHILLQSLLKEQGNRA